MYLKTLTAAATIALAGTAFAQDNPQVGGADMMADMTIAENASNAPNLSTLVAAAAQADLVETLGSEGPFTVFAPTDDAFGMLKDDSLEALMMDENKAQLAQILTCHVVSGAVDATTLIGLIEEHDGSHEIETVGGCMMTATLDGDSVTITDQNGRAATVTTADVMQSNGVVHVVDRVLLPEGQSAS